jgi:O-antigen ligase
VAEIVFVAALGLQRARQVEKQTNQWPVAWLAALLIVVTIVAGIFWIGAEPVIFRLTTGNPTGEASTQTFFGGRSEIWRNTWRMVQNHPFGIGLGAYETAYPIYRRDNVLNGIVAEAHNDYLQVLSDAGIPGGILIVWFLWVMTRAIRRVTRMRDGLTAGLALGASGGVFGMLIHSFFDFNLQLPSHSLLLLFLAGMVSSVGARGSEKEFPSQRSNG